MQTKQALFFTFVSLVGGFFGSAFFSKSHVTANAQAGTPYGQLGGQDPKVIQDNQIFVPEQGLRFVNASGRVIAYMGLTGGNSLFVLLDSNGSPAVSMIAGPGGKIAMSALAPGATIEVSSPSNDSVAGITVAIAKSGFYATASGATAQLSMESIGSTLSLPGPNRAPGIDLTGSNSGGTMTLFGDSKRPGVTIEGDGPGGLINVRDSKGLTTASINGGGKFLSIAEGKTVWQGPPVATKQN